MKQLLSLLLSLCLLVSLSACADGEASSAAPASAAPASAAALSSEDGAALFSAESEDAVSAAVNAPSGTASAEPSAASQGAEETETKTATLYIGMAGQFQEYPVEYSGELTPLFLVSQISQLTGWNLDLADEITSGKGGMTVSFAPESAIFTGPPEEQKDGFHMYSTEQLCYTIFDSVQKTLQENFSPADPSALDVYFCTDGSQEIVIENLGITLPIDTPYSHAMFEQLLMSATLGAGGETEAAPVG